MAPPSQKEEHEISTVESAEVLEGGLSEDHREMTRKVLMKLDLHILPLLALVRKFQAFN